VEAPAERRFFALSFITSRINALLRPAIVNHYWVEAEIFSGRERGGCLFCDFSPVRPY